MKRVYSIFIATIFLFLLVVPCFASDEYSDLYDEWNSFYSDESDSSSQSVDYSESLEVIHNDLEQAITALYLLAFILCFGLALYIFKFFI